MSYYVSAIAGNKRFLVIGPFRRHGDALRWVDPFASWVERNFQFGWSTPVGTAHNRTSHRPGQFNQLLGVKLAEDGYLVVLHG